MIKKPIWSATRRKESKSGSAPEKPLPDEANIVGFTGGKAAGEEIPDFFLNSRKKELSNGKEKWREEPGC